MTSTIYTTLLTHKEVSKLFVKMGIYMYDQVQGYTCMFMHVQITEHVCKYMCKLYLDMIVHVSACNTSVKHLCAFNSMCAYMCECMHACMHVYVSDAYVHMIHTYIYSK